jgi:hypothetical protein
MSLAEMLVEEGGDLFEHFFGAILEGSKTWLPLARVAHHRSPRVSNPSGVLKMSGLGATKVSSHSRRSLAEGVGFEPTMGLHPWRFSRPLP